MSSAFGRQSSSTFGSSSVTRQRERESHPAFSSSAARAFGPSPSSSFSSSTEKNGAFNYRSKPAASSGGFGPSTRAKAKEEPVVVAASFTDFPSLKKAPAAAAAPSKPVMNFKAVAAAAASKPAPIPTGPIVKNSVRPYYQDEMEDYDEYVDLEITDEDGGLNSRRAGDKSNW